MVEIKHKKGTPHSSEVIEKILELFDSGMREKTIALQSKKLIGYKIQPSTISSILNRNGRNVKENTYRIHRRKRED
jgi:hypothetical protein